MEDRPASQNRVRPARTAAARTAACLALAALAAAAALAGCEEDSLAPDGSVPVKITVSPDRLTMAALGQPVQFSASLRNVIGRPLPGDTFTWASSDPSVATVDATGLVTSIADGEATITASAAELSGSASVTVAQAVTHLAFAAAPNGWLGRPLAPPVRVEFRDANNRRVLSSTSYAVVSLRSNPTAATLQGTRLQNAVAGAVVFPDLSLDKLGTGYTLEATSDTLSVESEPFHVTRPSVWVGSYLTDTLAVISTTSNSVVADLTSVRIPSGVAITPDGLFAYVSSITDSTVTVIETITNGVVATVKVGAVPYWPTISPDGRRAYVGNYASNTLSVIDTETRTVVATVTPGVGPLDVAVTPDGSLAYVADYGGAAVSAIATASNTVVAQIPVGALPIGVVITPNGARAYVLNYSSNTLSVVNIATQTVVATVSILGYFPYLGAISPDGLRIYVSCPPNNAVAVIRTDLNVLETAIGLGAGANPTGIGITPDGAYVYVANNVTGTVSVIATATHSVVATIPVGSGLADLAVMPAPLPN
jgi:YVTN family beta-propeller protein